MASSAAAGEWMYMTTNAGVRMPKLIYGTAWKKERTTELVEEAIEMGFRGIDTACQPRHYREDLVGEAIQNLFDRNVVTREDLFLQTKYTPPAGQDPNNIPYNPRAGTTTQVLESFNTSLRNLGVEYVDSLVLHSPLNTPEKTQQAWRAMEEIQMAGKAKQIGISNCYDLKTLQDLHSNARVKPSVLQNRFYVDSLYDRELRKWCKGQNIIYQSFWTLTANPGLLYSPTLKSLAEKHGKTSEQVLFRYLIDSGAAPLTGTTDRTHMRQDLDAVKDFSLSSEEVSEIDKLIDFACEKASTRTPRRH